MKTKTNVIVRLQVEGLHHWPGVVKHPELEPVHFLASLHRHIFHITAKKEVSHDDRDVEIIMLKRNILEYLNKRYWVEHGNTHFFGTMSCEMIANELVKYFALDYCEVSEDGENGAEVIEKNKQEPTEIVITDRRRSDPDLSFLEKSSNWSETVSKAPWVTTATNYSNQLKFPF